MYNMHSHNPVPYYVQIEREEVTEKDKKQYKRERHL